MSAPGTPRRDAAAAACRNAAHELTDVHNRVAAALAEARCMIGDVTAVEMRGALSCISKAAAFLDEAADDLYRDGEGDA